MRRPIVTPIAFATKHEIPLDVVQTILDDWLELGIVERMNDGYALTTKGWSCASGLLAGQPEEDA